MSETTHKAAVQDMTTIEEYAIWLVETGIADSAHDDMNEGCDPITERGEEVSDEDWLAAKRLARDCAAAIEANPQVLLELAAQHKEASA